MFLVRILGGLAIVALGTSMVIKTEPFFEFFGRIPWAEQKFGDSRLFYKLLGVVACFIGILTMTNLFGAFFLGTVGRLFFLNR